MQAHLPGGSDTKAARTAVEKHRKIAKNLFALKYPGVEMTEKRYRNTCALEIKYDLFNEEDIVVEISKMSNEEVSMIHLNWI